MLNYKKYHVYSRQVVYIIATDDMVVAQQYSAIYDGFIADKPIDVFTMYKP